MTKKYATTTYWVCIDCHMVHHIGDEHEVLSGLEVWNTIEDDQTYTSGLLQEDHQCGWEEMDSNDEPPCDGECETATFSWADCEGCGTNLGGQRFAYTVWTPED